MQILVRSTMSCAMLCPEALQMSTKSFGHNSWVSACGSFENCVVLPFAAAARDIQTLPNQYPQKLLNIPKMAHVQIE